VGEKHIPWVTTLSPLGGGGGGRCPSQQRNRDSQKGWKEGGGGGGHWGAGVVRLASGTVKGGGKKGTLRECAGLGRVINEKTEGEAERPGRDLVGYKREAADKEKKGGKRMVEGTQEQKEGKAQDLFP